MQNSNNLYGKKFLEQIAHRVMQEHGFLPDFSPAALDEMAHIQKIDTGVTMDFY
jgi:hypothetical protein